MIKKKKKNRLLSAKILLGKFRFKDGPKNVAPKQIFIDYI